MSKDGTPPRFKFWQPPKPAFVAKKENRGRHRVSPRKRGYDAYWDKISLSFRRSHPWCLFCQQTVDEAAWQTTAVTDHVLPAHEFPELRLKRTNWIPLCGYHHDHTKQRLESYARANNCLPLLVGWVKYPMTRPQHLRPIALAPGWPAIAEGLGWSGPSAS